MKPIKRIATTISAQFTELVDQLENNEAVAEAALKDFKIQLREAKLQKRMLQKSLSQLESEANKCNREQKLWEDRAKKYHSSDKEKALECVRRINRWKTECENVESRRKRIEESYVQLSEKIIKIEAQYGDLSTQYQEYVSRSKAANIDKKFSYMNQSENDIGEVFGRWEKKIIRSEVEGEFDCDDFDALEQEMKSEEESAELEIQLEELIKS